LTASWLSVAALASENGAKKGAKIPAPKTMAMVKPRNNRGNMAGFRSCRAAVIVLGNDR